jgi:hypothetical protein
MVQSTAPVDNQNIFLSLNTLSFLHIQSDKMMEIKLSHPNKYVKPMVHPMKPIPKILATLVGGYKVETMWMIDHIDLAK